VIEGDGPRRSASFIVFVGLLGLFVWIAWRLFAGLATD
jgi:hypothetical protein